MNTQEKVNRNLTGLAFLNSRPDTKDMEPCTGELDSLTSFPAFHVCRYIMRDNVTVIQISLRVNITTYADTGEQYTHRDIQGRGTTFEMALFDLSAELVRLIDDNDVIDTEELPIIQEGRNHGRTEDSNESVRADSPGTTVGTERPVEQDAGKGVAARSDNSSGSETSRRWDSGSKRKSTSGRGRGSRSKRSSR